MDYAVNKEKVIMALTLDKVRRCERIVIGVEYQVRRRLAGSGNSEVLYDCERPLGELLYVSIHLTNAVDGMRRIAQCLEMIDAVISLKTGSWDLQGPLSKSYGTQIRIIP